MPIYEYRCEEHGEFDQLFKTLPSEEKQKSFPCPDCDKPSVRLLSSFSAGNTQNGEIEKAVAIGMEKVDIGGRMRPVYRDEDGKMHEIKSMFDINRWKKHNQNGLPRMVKWKNPKTGEESMVPLRRSMQVDPATGEPAEPLFGINPIVREAVEMVEVDHFEMPTETRNGIPLDPKTGTMKIKDISKIPVPGTGGLLDPETRQPMTFGDVWGSKLGGDGTRENAKARMAGRQMGKDEVVRRLAADE